MTSIDEQIKRAFSELELIVTTTGGSQIENRLATLLKLKNAMELEHHNILYKIAFSPIYGDVEFGRMILNGASDIVLIDFYEQLFSQFESYRKLNSNSMV